MFRSLVYVKYTNVMTIKIPSKRPITTALVELSGAVLPKSRSKLG